MACGIRCGTYSGEFKRLLSERKALRAFAADPRVIIDGEREQCVNATPLSRLRFRHKLTTPTWATSAGDGTRFGNLFVDAKSTQNLGNDIGQYWKLAKQGN